MSIKLAQPFPAPEFLQDTNFTDTKRICLIEGEKKPSVGERHSGRHFKRRFGRGSSRVRNAETPVDLAVQ